MARYIATQGPYFRPYDTVSDFWRMMWHEKVDAIIMVTNLIETGKRKCDKYWPDAGTSLQAYDMEIVQDEPEEDNESYIIRTFNVTRNGDSRKVTQYHYLVWPDHGVPLEVSTLAEMITIIHANHRYGPTVIHCSAGIGRTGTVLLVILCLEEFERLKFLDMKDNFLRLRNCRPKLIQNFGQYQFSHLLLWAILFENKTSFPNYEFVNYWQIIQNSAGNELKDLQEQFRKLKNFNKELTFSVARRCSLKKLNRYANVLPADDRRVALQGISGRESDQYINAIEVDGFNCKDAYIVAEHPLPETLDRLWIMVLERQIPVWVLLNEVPTNDSSFPPVIPKEIGECLELGLVTIELLETISHEYYQENNVRIYSLLDCYPDAIFETKVFQLYGWTDECEVPNVGPDAIHSLLDYIQSIGPFVNPILFSCLDGLTACGLTLALDITRQRAQSTQKVNIFRTCLDITYMRPEFIVSMEQYEFLHEAMAVYFMLQNEEIYCDVDDNIFKPVEIIYSDVDPK